MVLCFRVLRSGFLKVWRPTARTKWKEFTSWIHERQLKLLTLLKQHTPRSVASYFRTENLTSTTSRHGEPGKGSTKLSKRQETPAQQKPFFAVTWLLGQETKPPPRQRGASHPFASPQGEVEGNIYNWDRLAAGLRAAVEERYTGSLYCILYSNNCCLSLHQKRHLTVQKTRWGWKDLSAPGMPKNSYPVCLRSDL